MNIDARADRAAEKEQQQLGELEAARAALERISRMQTEGRIPPKVSEDLRREYEDRLREVQDRVDPVMPDGNIGAVRRELIQAERGRIFQLRAQGRINDHALGELERRLDLWESLLD